MPFSEVQDRERELRLRETEALLHQCMVEKDFTEKEFAETKNWLDQARRELKDWQGHHGSQLLENRSLQEKTDGNGRHVGGQSW